LFLKAPFMGLFFGHFINNFDSIHYDIIFAALLLNR